MELFKPKPNNIQIELMEGCNRMCAYCGIHAIWASKGHRTLKPMPTALSAEIAQNLASWWGDKGKRVEFAMHGEPTLHPDLLKILKTFRKTLPNCQLQLTTNGIVLLKKGLKFLEALMDNLNILIIDTYTNREQLKTLANGSTAIVCDYYEDTSFTPYHFINNHIKIICLMEDLGKMSGKRASRTIINHAGNSNPNNLLRFGIKPITRSLKKKCSRPFREISIHHDGTISLCCLDWRHEFVIAKFPEDGDLKDIWHDNKTFAIIRHLLYKGNREIVPCRYCDYNGGFRLGLLPKFQLSITDKECFDHITKHLSKYRKFAHPTARPVSAYKKQFNIREFQTNSN